MLGLGKGHIKGTWYTNWRKHPGKGVQGEGIWVTDIYGCRKHTLTPLQQNHEVYEPIEAYSEQFSHNPKTGEGTPIEGTRQRSDLPPLYMQWKHDWKRRLLNVEKQKNN